MAREVGFDGRPATVTILALCAVALSLGACVAHALSNEARVGPPLPGRARFGAGCMMADEDLRHPGWARSEQARAGQPLLQDPRAARWFASPVPLRVVR